MGVFNEDAGAGPSRPGAGTIIYALRVSDPYAVYPWELKSPYEARDFIKLVSPNHRQWDKLARVWRLTDYGMGSLRMYAMSYGVEIREVADPGRQAPPPPPPRRQVGRSWALELLAACTPAIADQVFRALVSVLHPDRGGDTQLMQDLNAARDKLRGRR